MGEKERKQIFEEWLREHKGLFFKFVRAYAFTENDRDDLFQEIAIQVWHSIPGFKGDAAVTTWIYRITINTAITTLYIIKNWILISVNLTLLYFYNMASNS